MLIASRDCREKAKHQNASPCCRVGKEGWEKRDEERKVNRAAVKKKHP